MKKVVCLTVVAACVSAVGYQFAVTSPAKAQSGTKVPPQKAGPVETRFWDWLVHANYRHWAPGPGQHHDKFLPGEAPHGALLKLYCNRTAAANPKDMPPGSVIVKENFSEDKKLLAITVMYRSKGYDPEHHDWWWAKYMPDGTVAKAPKEKGGMKLVGKVRGCIMCHSGADGKDFAFLND